ncbi:hypothetical protein ANCCAN_20686 [Ancylostoma caninum]|uniref:Uncharacterized protein n=1 Tax=Ancylostoma caninum TaxID=29170 RepID=A0A368FTB8_ANCCA|nr:hypothetical protein ANCCAN_20686 [Ancylostoma caninum]
MPCAVRRSAAVAVGFRENCFPKPSGGCKCDIDDGSVDTMIEFATDDECKKPTESISAVSAQNRVDSVISKRAGVETKELPEAEKTYAVVTAENKKKLGEEIHQKFGAFKVGRPCLRTY